MKIILLILIVCFVIVNIIYFTKRSRIIKELDKLEKEYNVRNKFKGRKKNK